MAPGLVPPRNDVVSGINIAIYSRTKDGDQVGNLRCGFGGDALLLVLEVWIFDQVVVVGIHDDAEWFAPVIE